MSRERRHIEIAFVVEKPEHLPSQDGEQMYADDVVQELREVVIAAVAAWYQVRGKDLLTHEPLI
jgi:hypothetical protein